MTTRARSISLALMLFLLGAAGGATFVLGLSKLAARDFVLGAGMRFRAEQDLATTKAWRAGDFDAALIHAACAVEATGARRSAFDPDDAVVTASSLASEGVAWMLARDRHGATERILWAEEQTHPMG